MTHLFKRSCQHLTPQQSRRLAKLLYEFEDIFATDDLDIGIFNGEIEHQIYTGDSHPIRQKMRTPLGFEKEEEEHLQQLLEKGIIEPSSSEWD